MAGNGAAVFRTQRGFLISANSFRTGTTSMEPAAGGDVHRTWNIAFEQHFFPVALVRVGYRHGRE